MNMQKQRNNYTVKATKPIFPLVSIKKLEFILGKDRTEISTMANIVGRMYSPFDRRVYGNTKWRHIDNPVEPLKSLQRIITKKILQSLPLPDGMYGGVKGKSIKGNALIHIGTPMVVTLDLKDCYPSISHEKIYQVFIECFGCSSDIANKLTKLTTYQGRVPQGAPSSSILANIALIPMYEEIYKLVSDKNIVLSFFVDDITLSGYGAEKLIEPVIRIIQKHGHAISSKKKHIMPSNTQQEVTGIIVNKKTSISRNKYEKIRAEIVDLADSENIMQYQLNSIKGKITNVRSYSQIKADSLQRLSDNLLPAIGATGKKEKNYETMECHCARRHMHHNLSRT